MGGARSSGSHSSNSSPHPPLRSTQHRLVQRTRRLGFAADAHGLLRVPSADPSSWTLALASHTPDAPGAMSAQGELRALIARGAAAAGGDGFASAWPEATDAVVCDARHAFATRTLDWKPVHRSARSLRKGHKAGRSVQEEL